MHEKIGDENDLRLFITIFSRLDLYITHLIIVNAVDVQSPDLVLFQNGLARRQGAFGERLQ